MYVSLNANELLFPTQITVIAKVVFSLSRLNFLDISKVVLLNNDCLIFKTIHRESTVAIVMNATLTGTF